MLLCEGEAEEIGMEHSSLWVKTAEQSEKSFEKKTLPDHVAALRYALFALEQRGFPKPDAIGHRFVHGGPEIREHQQISPEVLQKLRAALPFAPLHLPVALAVHDALARELAGVPQFACLDTAFHRTMTDVGRAYALPEDVRKLGVERYGFHGLSCESILAQLTRLPQNLIVAHLGNGASVTAIRAGRSVDTSMGMTPAGGLIMGTRCGDLDPGVMVYLARHGYADPSRFDKLINTQSGLLGLSGKSSDVRELSAIRARDQRSDLALRAFCYTARKTIAGMASALGGIDTLIFTGGIGEHATELRNEICSGLAFLGRFQTLVLPSEEDLQIARITSRLLN